MKLLTLLLSLVTMAASAATKYTDFGTTNAPSKAALVNFARGGTNLSIALNDLPPFYVKTNGIADVTVIDLAKPIAVTNINSDITITGTTGGSSSNVSVATRIYNNVSGSTKALNLPSAWLVPGGNTQYITNKAILTVTDYPGYGTMASVIFR